MSVYSGVEVVADSTLRKLQETAPLKQGSPLDADAAQADSAVADECARRPWVCVPRASKSARTLWRPDLVSVEFHAEPGGLGYFGPIQIIGNINIEDDVIRREVAYLPGQRFHAGLLRETQHRLALLGLFESVVVEVAEPDRPVVEVPTRITLKETDINKFAYSFGYGTEEQLSGEAQWRHLNLFGGGRAGTIRGRWSSIDRGGEAAFRQPYLFTSKLSLQVSAYVWEWDEPVYSVLSRGGSGSLSYAIGRLNRVTATYLHQFETNRIPIDALADFSPTLLTTPGPSFDRGQSERLLSAIRFEAARDTTSDAVSPRTGHRVSFRVEHAGGWLPGSFNYDNVFTSGSYYQRTGAVVLAGRVQFGSIVSDSVVGLPFLETLLPRRCREPPGVGTIRGQSAVNERTTDRWAHGRSRQRRSSISDRRTVVGRRIRRRRQRLGRQLESSPGRSPLGYRRRAACEFTLRTLPARFLAIS
jgi:hypothetical protein